MERKTRLVTSTPIGKGTPPAFTNQDVKTILSQHTLDSTQSRPSYERSTCGQCHSRLHPNLTILVVFIAVMVDVMLMTVIEPILPDVMLEMDLQPGKLVSDQFISKAAVNSSMTLDKDLIKKHSTKIAFLIGLKPGLEIAFNIAVGILVDRTGHYTPMVSGCLFNVTATLGFAYFRNYYLLILARVLQAAGSSLSVIGGLAFLASSFPDDRERSMAVSKAFAGISFGVAGGYALGSLLYQFCGRETPYLIIAGLNIVDGVLRLLLLSPSTHGTQSSNSFRTLKSLLTDCHILAGLLINFVENLCLGIFLGTGPAWMLYSLQAQQWNIGIILAVAAVVHIVVLNLTARVAISWGQWKFVFVGLLLLAFGTTLYPFCTSPWEVIIPETITRAGHGMLMACVNPVLCHLVDVRHGSHYGLINGLYTATYNMGLFAGPNIGGALLQLITFQWLYWGLAALLVAFSFTALAWKSVCELEPTSIESSYGSSCVSIKTNTEEASLLPPNCSSVRSGVSI